MRTMIESLRARAGEFWWYSLLIFLACRSGDAIQAFIGLWLVPHYVPQEELGAALPLLQIGGVFGLPLAIFVLPFSRWLTLYAARGEYGKVKRLLSLSFTSVCLVFALALLSARYILPLFFERVRVAEGSLGLLIIGAGLIGPFSSVFNNALQGLKRFRTMAAINVIGAPVRLAVMLAAMPFRALSGYMAGQIAAPAANVGIACFALRKELGRRVKSVPLGRDDVRAMGRYTAPAAVYLAAGALTGAWFAMLVRQRLPELESAAFYMISRLTEIATYAGLSLSVVVFPLAAEASEKGERGHTLLWKLLGGTCVCGLAVTLALAAGGRTLLSLMPLWRDYAPFAPLMSVYALRMTLNATVGVFCTYEMAAGRFRFLLHWLPYALVETGGLVALTGAGAFQGILPDSAVDWMASLDAARLSFFIRWLFACTAAEALAVAAHVAGRLWNEKRRTR